jgi:hypothetical protein
VFLDDDITRFGAELWVELAAPLSHLESFGVPAMFHEHVQVLPAIVVMAVRVGAMVRNDKHLNAAGARSGDDLAEVVKHPGFVRCRLDQVVELPALRHEIVVRIHDQKSGSVCGVRLSAGARWRCCRLIAVTSFPRTLGPQRAAYSRHCGADHQFSPGDLALRCHWLSYRFR